MPTQVAPTGNPLIDGLLWGWRWDSPNLTVSFPTSLAAYGGYADIQGFQPFTQFQANQIVNFGLNNLGVFTNLSFTFDPSEFGNLRFAQAQRIDYGPSHFNSGLHIPGGRGSAEANPPDGNWVPGYAQGDNWFTLGAYTQPVLGSFQYAAGLLHEVGHALGLKHGHAMQGWSATGQENVFAPLPAEWDSQEFSVMTYRSHVGADLSNGATGQEEYPWTYMMLDYLVLQYLYGANFGPGSNNGDTLYQFSPATGELFIDGFGFGASYNAKILATLWDGGGIDHFEFSNFDNDQWIDLRPGQFSTFSQAQLSNLSNGSGQVNLARGNIANPLLYQGDVRSLIENVTTGIGNDGVTGNHLGNVIATGAGADTVRALDGDDTVDAGAGRDLVFLAGGNDFFIGDTVSGPQGNDTVYGAAGSDTLNGGGGADLLGGGADDDVLNGGDGADALWTSLGNDTASGGAGNDTLGGGAGNDVLNGGEGADELWTSLGGDTASGGAGNDTLGGAGGDDDLAGDGGDDELWGAIGNDRLRGGAGRDQLGGGPGNDLLEGHGGNDSLYGGTGNDTVRGGDGDDLIFGASGADLLGGGGGADTIFAGPDADVILFGPGGGGDRVEFFSASQDILRLDAALWTGTLTPWQVANRFGGVQGADYVLDFGGGNTVTLAGQAGIADPYTQIDIV